MTHDKMIETVALRLNMDKDRVAYIVDRYLRTLSLRLKRRDDKFKDKDSYYKGTYYVNICNMCYARYSWNLYTLWQKHVREHDSSKSNGINDK